MWLYKWFPAVLAGTSLLASAVVFSAQMILVFRRPPAPDPISRELLRRQRRQLMPLMPPLTLQLCLIVLSTGAAFMARWWGR